MSPAVQSTHPTHRSLALYVRGDLSWVAKAKLRNHLRGCDRCQQYVASLETALGELRREAETQTLTGFEAIADWSRLEREMLGNIAVGVAAARCVDHVGRGRRTFAWTAAVAALTLLFAAGWATHIPREQTEHIFAAVHTWATRTPRSTGTVLRSSPDGVAVRAQGSTLTLMHPRSAVVSVSSTSGMEARYVDTETGQVTITSVYAQ
ncbi:MAG: zf-HC2 domain-containing protein [Bryobacteraceae bacterium]